MKKLSNRVFKICTARGVRVAVAESLTGGLISDEITNCSGSSQYFQGAVIAYANTVKVRVLGVKSSTLKRYGAVSRQCAIEMAIGVRRKMQADIGVASTGIAGPTGGSARKPVGTVWIAVCGPGQLIAKRFCFVHKNRRSVKTESTKAALSIVLEALKKRKKKKRWGRRQKQLGFAKLP